MFVFTRCFDRSTHIQFCESRHLGKTFDCLVVNLVVAFVIPGILMFSYSKWCSLPRKRTPFEPMLLSAWLVRLLQISRLVSPGRFSTSNLQPPSPILHVPTFLFIYWRKCWWLWDLASPAPWDASELPICVGKHSQSWLMTHLYRPPVVYPLLVIPTVRWSRYEWHRSQRYRSILVLSHDYLFGVVVSTCSLTAVWRMNRQPYNEKE